MSIVDNKPLTAQDRTTLDYFDGVVEERLASSRTGGWIEVKLDKTMARARVVALLKKRIEIRGRQVGVFEEAQHWRLTFPPPVAALPPVAVQQTLVLSAAPVSQWDVLVRMPTRGRPAQAITALEAYRRLSGYPVTIEAVVDSDDEKMLSSEVLQRLCALDVVVTVGDHKNKVEALNGGRILGWDILFLVSDDMYPVADGYVNILVDEMAKHFPHLDGVLFTNDGYAGDRCCTAPVIGCHLHDQFGTVYSPEYKSLYCDLEQTDVLRAMGRLVYVDKMIVEHRHPAAHKAPFDALYDQNERRKNEDSLVYERRQSTWRPHAQFGFDAPPMALSVCIATLPERREQLDRLIEYLYGQIIRDAPRQVEVLVDDGLGEVGAKRQRLIERAVGHYVAHVDDDDLVSHGYIKCIVNAIESSNYAADCVSLSGMVTVDGGGAKAFYHSIKYREWYTDNNGTYYRSPNHLNPIRRDLALKSGFPVGVSHGEDYEFSKRLYPFLHREVSPGPSCLYHYWSRTRPTKKRES